MNQESVNAQLVMTLATTGEVKTLVNGDLIVTVEEDRIAPSDHMEGLVTVMNNICTNNANGSMFTWTLNMAYEGRCWWMEMGEHPDSYELGYYDLPTVEGWLAINRL